MAKTMRLPFKRPWTVAAIVVAVVLYAVALSGAAYELTSPSTLSFHVWLRKSYSIVAFALVGYLFRRATLEGGGKHPIAAAILGTALYSAIIEVGQAFVGSKEGLSWNAVDTLCGAIGGTVGAADLIFARLRARSV
jgi:hypothetical protein